MSHEADAIVDRRRLTRRVRFWRILTIIVAFAAIGGFALSRLGRGGFDHSLPHIARVAISGIILGEDETIRLLKKVEDASAAEAVVLTINSPGGTVSGSEELFQSIRKLAAKKPVVAVVGNTAASGAYIAAIGTDHIVSRGGAIVGSIGVLAQVPNATDLLDKIGIHVETVRSSPLKAMPSGIEPTPPEARKALEETVLDSFAWFKALVKERRKMSDDELAKVADGRVFTGRQALPLKLIDEIGGEDEAIAWLQKEKNIKPDRKVETWKRPDSSGPLGFMRGMALAADMLGFEQVGRILNGWAGRTGSKFAVGSARSLVAFASEVIII